MIIFDYLKDLGIDTMMQLFIILGMFALVIWIIKTIITYVCESATNKPTWEGVILSAAFGVLPFYLFMCWIGYWGEERDE